MLCYSLGQLRRKLECLKAPYCCLIENNVSGQLLTMDVYVAVQYFPNVGNFLQKWNITTQER